MAKGARMEIDLDRDRVEQWRDDVESGVAIERLRAENEHLYDGERGVRGEPTASEIAASWWSLDDPPFDIGSGSPFFIADAIDIRETIMLIASWLGGPERLPEPLAELWEPLGVQHWEVRRLGQLRSWHAAARMTDSMSGGEVPNVWPHPAGFRRVPTVHDLRDSGDGDLFPRLKWDPES
jgi:hypothetical protein